MKPSLKLPLLVATLTGACSLLAPTAGAAIAIDDWYAINNSTSASVLNGDSTSPTFNVDNNTSIWAFGYFDSTTLAAGDTLSITFDLTLNLGEDGVTKGFENMVFGLYNSSTPKVTTTLFGTDRTASSSIAGSTIQNWSGFVASKPGRFSSHPISIFQKVPSGNTNFASISSAGIAAPGTALDGTAGFPMTFTDGVARTFTFTLNRSGNDLIVSGSFSATQSFSTTLTDAFLVPNSNLFDAFGFYTSQSTGQTRPDTYMIDSATFSNITLTHTAIPEPSSIALLAAAGAGAMLWRRRSQRV